MLLDLLERGLAHIDHRQSLKMDLVNLPVPFPVRTSLLLIACLMHDIPAITNKRLNPFCEQLSMPSYITPFDTFVSEHRTSAS
jgi:hypothetical protein